MFGGLLQSYQYWQPVRPVSICGTLRFCHNRMPDVKPPQVCALMYHWLEITIVHLITDVMIGPGLLDRKYTNLISFFRVHIDLQSGFRWGSNSTCNHTKCRNRPAGKCRSKHTSSHASADHHHTGRLSGSNTGTEEHQE